MAIATESPTRSAIDQRYRSVSGWLADPSGPKQFSQLWSGSDSSNLCSADGAGDSGSGEYAMIDFNPRPTSESDFGPCRGGTQPADTNYQNNTVPPNIVDWIQNGYPGSIAYGQYLCGRVGQTYGASVDQALCKVRGKQAAILIVDGANFDRKSFNNGNGTDASAKQWIVRVSGVALVKVDDYTDQSMSNRCGALGYAAGLRTRHPKIGRAHV